jgi:hypothetical protein
MGEVMKYKTALKQLDKEMDFLGVEWSRLVNLLRYSPLIFGQRTTEAWHVVLREHNNVIEELL